MSTAVAGSKVFEEVFHNVRQATEANLKLQQEAFRQWSSLWPVPTVQASWADSLRDFQKQWVDTISGLARKHRDIADKQYQAAIESLDAALHSTEATNPEEFRRRCEQLCRQTLDYMRDASEAQIREFQEGVTKCTELMTKAGK